MTLCFIRPNTYFYAPEPATAATTVIIFSQPHEGTTRTHGRTDDDLTLDKQGFYSAAYMHEQIHHKQL